MEGIRVGVRGESITRVDASNLAKTLGSGGLEVFSTPSLITLMERAALESVSPYLSEGTSTVGTLVNVRHLAASVEGAVIRCESELTGVDRRRLTFSVRAYDGKTLVGEGIHERFIVNDMVFMEKARAGRED